VNFDVLYIDRRRAGEEFGSISYVFYGDEVSGTTLPVYTSPESRTRAMKALASTLRGSDYVGFDPKNPFALLGTIEWLEEYRLETLLFDPLLAPDGKLRITADPIPVVEYRKAVEGIDLLFEKLDAEAANRFFRESHLKKEPFVRWPNARAEDIAADLRAWIEEWIY
jgi:hypothetical protein